MSTTQNDIKITIDRLKKLYLNDDNTEYWHFLESSKKLNLTIGEKNYLLKFDDDGDLAQVLVNEKSSRKQRLANQNELNIIYSGYI